MQPELVTSNRAIAAIWHAIWFVLSKYHELKTCIVLSIPALQKKHLAVHNKGKNLWFKKGPESFLGAAYSSMSSLNQSGYKDDANEVNSPGAVTWPLSPRVCRGGWSKYCLLWRQGRIELPHEGFSFLTTVMDCKKHLLNFSIEKMS